jgi:hypothetical protein
MKELRNTFTSTPSKRQGLREIQLLKERIEKKVFHKSTRVHDAVLPEALQRGQFSADFQDPNHNRQTAVFILRFTAGKLGTF